MAIRAKFKLFLLFTLLSFLLQIKVLAAGIDLPNPGVTPDLYTPYSIKRLIEKGVLFLKFSPTSKITYYKDLTALRASELKYIAEKRLIGEIQHSSERLSAQVGLLADYMNNKNVSVDQKREIIDFLNQLKPVLASLRDKYPSNSSYWLLLQDSINSIDLNIQKLK